MYKVALFCLLVGMMVVSLDRVEADTMAAFEISLANIDNAGLGDTVVIPIEYVSGTELFASYDFLVSFDTDKLEFIDAFPGSAIVSCNWDQFSFTEVGSTGYGRQLYLISAVADVADAAVCLPSSGELAQLRIKVPIDESAVGEVYSLDFYWENCESNVMLSGAEDTLWFGKFVYDYTGADITGQDPNLGGTPPGCITPNGVVPIRGINYHGGSITMTTELGLWGDCNGDGRVNVADIAFLIRFLFYAGPTPRDYLSGDLNQDGSVNIADAVRLIGYIFYNRR